MHHTVTHYHLDPGHPISPRAALLNSSGNHTLSLTEECCLFGPRDYLVKLLQAGLDALTDGSVAWGPDGAEVVPLRRPGKRRVTIGVDDDQLEALVDFTKTMLTNPESRLGRLAREILAAAAEPELVAGRPIVRYPNVGAMCACEHYVVNPDDPSEGTDITAASRSACPIHGRFEQEAGPGAA